MNPDLEGLVRLQHAESELRRVEVELGDVPNEKVALDGRLASERARLDEARAGLAESQKARRQFEGELQELETKRSKYKGQLMDVKTNKEYTAVLHEIEGVEREIRAREDQILAEMERAEALAAEVKAEEAEFKSVEARHREDGKVLEARAEALKVDATRLTAERDAIASTIDVTARELFQRVARLRGVAVAEARDGMCQLCHMKLRPQMFMDLKRNDEIVQCPSCSRIIYYEPPAPVEAPQP
jgi:uncharacterized protein